MNIIKKTNYFEIILTLIFLFIAFIMIIPLWKVLVTSFADTKTIAQNSILLWPKKIDINAYRMIFSTNQILSSLGITVFITVIGVIYNLFLSLTLGYGLSIKELPGRRLFITLVIIPFFFVPGLIPYYLQIKKLGLINSVFAMILPLGINGWYLIMIKNFFQQIPSAMCESARIDGANDLIIFTRIILPLSKAMIATFLLFYAVDRWNEWWHAMMFLTNSSKRPLQSILRELVFLSSSASGMAASYRRATGAYVNDESVKMATAIITILPILCLYPFLQKYFVRGIMGGAIKG